MNAVEYYPTQPNYAKAIAKNGMDKFTDGTQAQRTAKHLHLSRSTSQKQKMEVVQSRSDCSGVSQATHVVLHKLLS
jgi:hypothetical protein